MKKNHFWRAPQLALCLTFMAATVGCAEQPKTPPKPVADQGSVSQAVEEPQDPNLILMRMAKFLAGTQQFSVNLQAGYDVVQESGQKIEFGENRTVLVSRPDGLRVEIEQSDGEQHLLLYDGTNITVFTPSRNLYAQATKPGGIDEAIMYFLKDLHMRLPLALLLTSRFPAEIESRTLSIDYVERTRIHGVSAHHLAGRTETVDYQVWIAEGAQPLPLRIVLTYKNSEGQPQYRTQFSDWNLSPAVQNALFSFAAPEGTNKISFVAQLPQAATKGAVTPRHTGEKK
jgi:hypothetical protein